MFPCPDPKKWNYKPVLGLALRVYTNPSGKLLNLLELTSHVGGYGGQFHIVEVVNGMRTNEFHLAFSPYFYVTAFLFFYFLAFGIQTLV